MSIKLNRFKDDILFASVGGTDEIGLNLYLYQYKGKWIAVDCGLGFADEHYPGIDILVPDIEFLKTIKNDLLGLVITHAHEDHLGAVQYVWSEIGAPIYTTPFTAAVLKTKLSETGQDSKTEIHELKKDSRFKIGTFDIEFVSLTHSVPDMQALAIRTDKGILFHTGDWKFDHDPVIVSPVDKNRLKALGDEGVLLMACDSTNVFSTGHSGSEGDLLKSLKQIVTGINTGMVVVSTFASNITRMHSLMAVARASKRKLVLSGTSLWRMYRCAVESGYLGEFDEPLTPKQIAGIPKSNLLVIATGCQGERFASTTKLAKGEHPDLTLNKGDTIIFASKIIPGNEKGIFELFNIFCKRGVEVLTEREHFVHVSGHPNLDEVKEMYELIRPKFAIPMHGEPMHLHEHSKFVRKHKLSEPLEVENGNVVKVDTDGLELLGSVETGYMAVDGNFIIPGDSEILSLRRRMAHQGALTISVVYSTVNGLIAPPMISAPGVLDPVEDEQYFEELSGQIEEFLLQKDLEKRHDVERKLRNLCKKYIKTETGKDPYITIHFNRVK